MCMRISLTKLLTTRFHSYTYVKRVSSNFKDKVFFFLPDIPSNIGSILFFYTDYFVTI